MLSTAAAARTTTQAIATRPPDDSLATTMTTAVTVTSAGVQTKLALVPPHSAAMATTTNRSDSTKSSTNLQSTVVEGLSQFDRTRTSSYVSVGAIPSPVATSSIVRRSLLVAHHSATAIVSPSLRSEVDIALGNFCTDANMGALLRVLGYVERAIKEEELEPVCPSHIDAVRRYICAADLDKSEKLRRETLLTFAALKSVVGTEPSHLATLYWCSKCTRSRKPGARTRIIEHIRRHEFPGEVEAATPTTVQFNHKSPPLSMPSQMVARNNEEPSSLVPAAAYKGLLRAKPNTNGESVVTTSLDTPPRIINGFATLKELLAAAASVSFFHQDLKDTEVDYLLHRYAPRMQLELKDVQRAAVHTHLCIVKVKDPAARDAAFQEADAGRLAKLSQLKTTHTSYYCSCLQYTFRSIGITIQHILRKHCSESTQFTSNNATIRSRSRKRTRANSDVGGAIAKTDVTTVGAAANNSALRLSKRPKRAHDYQECLSDSEIDDDKTSDGNSECNDSSFSDLDDTADHDGQNLLLDSDSDFSNRDEENADVGGHVRTSAAVDDGVYKARGSHWMGTADTDADDVVASTSAAAAPSSRRSCLLGQLEERAYLHQLCFQPSHPSNAEWAYFCQWVQVNANQECVRRQLVCLRVPKELRRAHTIAARELSDVAGIGSARERRVLFSCKCGTQSFKRLQDTLQLLRHILFNCVHGSDQIATPTSTSASSRTLTLHPLGEKQQQEQIQLHAPPTAAEEDEGKSATDGIGDIATGEGDGSDQVSDMGDEAESIDDTDGGAHVVATTTGSFVTDEARATQLASIQKEEVHVCTTSSADAARHHVFADNQGGADGSASAVPYLDASVAAALAPLSLKMDTMVRQLTAHAATTEARHAALVKEMIALKKLHSQDRESLRAALQQLTEDRESRQREMNAHQRETEARHEAAELRKLLQKTQKTTEKEVQALVKLLLRPHSDDKLRTQSRMKPSEPQTGDVLASAATTVSAPAAAASASSNFPHPVPVPATTTSLLDIATPMLPFVATAQPLTGRSTPFANLHPVHTNGAHFCPTATTVATAAVSTSQPQVHPPPQSLSQYQMRPHSQLQMPSRVQSRVPPARPQESPAATISVVHSRQAAPSDLPVSDLEMNDAMDLKEAELRKAKIATPTVHTQTQHATVHRPAAAESSPPLPPQSSAPPISTTAPVSVDNTSSTATPHLPVSGGWSHFVALATKEIESGDDW